MPYLALVLVVLLAADEFRARKQQRSSILRLTLRHPPSLVLGAAVFVAVGAVNVFITGNWWTLVAAGLIGFLVALITGYRSRLGNTATS